MKNLILADLKVLGHRLWSVPLMALVLVAGVSLIPNVEMADPVRNFMLALLSPCLLIFELFREEKKRGTDSLMLTMPVSKNVYVMAKYTTVIILSLTALPAGWIAAIFSNLIQGGGLSIAESISFLPNMLKIMAFIITYVFFALPLYFYSRKPVMSGIAAVLILFVSFYLLEVFYHHFYVSYYNENLYQIFYFAGIIVLFGATAHLIIKFRFNSVSSEIIKTIWFSLLFFLLLYLFQTLTNNLLIRLWTAYYAPFGMTKERWLQGRSDFRLYMWIITPFFVIIGSASIYLRKITLIKFWQNVVLYILTPPTILIVSVKAGSLIEIFFIHNSNNNVAEVLALISMIIVSYISSIYLLKNDRRLS